MAVVRESGVSGVHLAALDDVSATEWRLSRNILSDSDSIAALDDVSATEWRMTLPGLF